nr:reverse transcriptase domain-containing protein [Tanacetum cinerariifolium]GEZ43907.1 reverse transcriptase domain-containing protein [Tanacetum cinerariifolium]
MLCPSMVISEYKKIERYVWGRLEKIQGNATSSKPANTYEAIHIAHSLMDQAVRFKAARSGSNTQQSMTCFGYGEKGHYKNKCPKKKDQPTEGAHERSYVMRTEEPQQIPNVVTGKFKQWKFRIQQYLQHEHYAMWEVIEFGDSYVVPVNTTTTDTTSGEKSGRTVTLTAEDMQRKKNDVKARTTLVLSLLDEHQL